MSHKAVFLDKDGTLVEDVPYNVNPDLIVLTPGAISGLQRLHQAGYLLIVITNQSGIAHGYFTESDLSPVERHLQELLATHGIPLAGFYYCPHHLDGVVEKYAIACHCRKPQPGLLNKAAQDHTLDLSQSWFIGDILHDIEAGRAADCRTILIDNGNETEWELSPQRLPHHIIKDLDKAAQVILAVDSSPAQEPGYQASGLDSPLLLKTR